MCAFVILCSAYYVVITVKHNKSAAKTLNHALIDPALGNPISHFILSEV